MKKISHLITSQIFLDNSIKKKYRTVMNKETRPFMATLAFCVIFLVMLVFVLLTLSYFQGL